ncbi:MAG: hypothetical protein AAGA60_13820 [Cyanobacteria bacterium P01_E01_bin.42]
MFSTVPTDREELAIAIAVTPLPSVSIYNRSCTMGQNTLWQR